MTTGEIIKKIRLEKKITQKELAERLGTSPQNLAQYENGKRNPKYETLEKIAFVLDVSVADLMQNGAFGRMQKYSELFFASNLKKLIHKSGMTISDFADSLGVNRSLVIKWIDGEVLPTVEQLYRISDILGVSEAVLMGYFKKKPADEKEGQLLSAYRNLNQHGQSKALSYVEDLTKIPEYRKQQSDTSKDSTLQEEQTEDPDNIITIDPTLNAAHAMNPTEEEKKHADNIMQDDSEWE